MIFEGLADRLQETFKKLRGHGKLTEDDVNEAMRDVRMALLEADGQYENGTNVCYLLTAVIE